MNRLFIRIWLANWFVFVLVVFGSVFLFKYLKDLELKYRKGPPHLHDQELVDSLHSAVANGVKPEDWLSQVSNSRQTVYLLNEQDKDIAGRRLPAFFERGGSAGRPPRRPRLISISIADYPPLRLLNVRHRPRGLLFFPSVLLIGLAFFGSGLVAVLLTRYITSPIKQLYLATERIASGDFQSHVADSVSHRKDEIAELARRFDLMAKELDTANKNQQDLLRDVSHELRSPLARMQLISDMLVNTPDEERLSLQRRLSKELNELELLIDEVMTLTRFETEATALNLQRTDVITTIMPLIEDASFEANALNKTVTYCHDQRALFVNLSPTHFCRAVENIIRNGIRHTPEQTEVNVQAKRVQDRVIIVVSDCGEGVDEGELNKIFSPFYRSATARARYKGAGIGLALAERIVKAHQGEISAKNKHPHGLEVSISLPLLRGA